MRNRARRAVAAVAVTVTSPLLVATATPAHAVTLPGCPAATGKRVTDTPATYPKTVALTFDDGPSPTWTPQVLAVLAKHRVHATFFVIGRRAEAYPEVLQKVIDAGHVVGNHTWDHPTVGRDMYSLTPTQLVTEFDPTTALIKDATGRPVCFFRAPQGKDNTPTIRTLAKDRGMTVTGYYTASDYLQPNRLDPQWVAQIERRLEGKGNHPILLMHDSGTFRGNSVQALDAIITWYASRGYVFTDPAGRPFAADMPAGTQAPASGWAIPPDWSPPGDPLTGPLTGPQPTDLPTFPGTEAGGATGSAGTGTPESPTGDPSPTDGTTSPSTTADGASTGGVPTDGSPSGGPLSPLASPTTGGSPSRQPVSANQRLARLAANSAKDPLAARKLTDALARYLMVFSAPPA